MRPGNQNNKRIRGRGGRKGPNPLSRTYESNGPDVKIRGTAHHVAEKYQQLARDAAAAGDRVISENYYQHAEHYLRIIASAQQSMQQPVVLPRGDEAEDEAEAQTERAERQDRQDRRDRGDRGERGERGDRGERNERSDRGDRDAAKSDDGAKSVMPVDAPQPFVDNMPVLNAKSAGAGDGPATAKAKDEDDGDSGDDDDDRGRRRTRGTRGRGLRKARTPGTGDDAGAKDSGEGDAPAANGAAETAGGDAGEPEAPKPRARRTPRARTPKAAATDEKSETPATNDA